MKIVVLSGAALCLLFAGCWSPKAEAESRPEFLCRMATQHFAAFFPKSPPKLVREGRCDLGSVEAGAVDVYYPTLGTDSLERERIVTHAINSSPVDEPALGEGAFSVHGSAKDASGKPFYTVQYYARKNAQIFAITFKRYQPFTESDFKAQRAAILAYFDDLD